MLYGHRVVGVNGYGECWSEWLFLTVTSFKVFHCSPHPFFAFHWWDHLLLVQLRTREGTKGLRQPLSCAGRGQKPTKRCSAWAPEGPRGEDLPDQPHPPPNRAVSARQRCSRGDRRGLHGSSLMKAPATSVKANTRCLRCPRDCGSQGPGLLQELWRTASGFTAGKKYKGSSIQRHLVKYPFKPHVDLQEGSEWPSGGFRLPISAGQRGVHAQTPGCSRLHSPVTSCKHGQAAVHAPPGCSGAGCDTAAATAASEFLPTEFLNASVLHRRGGRGISPGGDLGQHTDSQGCPQPSSSPGKCGAGERAHPRQAKKP